MLGVSAAQVHCYRMPFAEALWWVGAIAGWRVVVSYLQIIDASYRALD